MLIKSSSGGLQKILNTSEINRSGYTHTHTHTNKSASNKTRNHFLTSRTALVRCVCSLECRERDACRTRSRNTLWSFLTWFVLPSRLICSTEKSCHGNLTFFFPLAEAERDSSPLQTKSGEWVKLPPSFSTTSSISSSPVSCLALRWTAITPL